MCGMYHVELEDIDEADYNDVHTDLNTAIKTLKADVNVLETEQCKLLVPGFGVPKFEPDGPVPNGKNGIKAEWDISYACWRNNDCSVFRQLSSNAKRDAKAAARMADLNAICARVDEETMHITHGDTTPIDVHQIHVHKLKHASA